MALFEQRVSEGDVTAARERIAAGASLRAAAAEIPCALRRRCRSGSRRPSRLKPTPASAVATRAAPPDRARLRRLVPDPELVRRRAAGETPSDWLARRYSPEHRARRLVRQLEALGFNVSMEATA
jgi:hypothetical protein